MLWHQQCQKQHDIHHGSNRIQLGQYLRHLPPRSHPHHHHHHHTITMIYSHVRTMSLLCQAYVHPYLMTRQMKEDTRDEKCKERAVVTEEDRQRSTATIGTPSPNTQQRVSRAQGKYFSLCKWCMPALSLWLAESTILMFERTAGWIKHPNSLNVWLTKSPTLVYIAKSTECLNVWFAKSTTPTS